MSSVLLAGVGDLSVGDDRSAFAAPVLPVEFQDTVVRGDLYAGLVGEPADGLGGEAEVADRGVDVFAGHAPRGRSHDATGVGVYARRGLLSSNDMWRDPEREAA